MSKMIIVEGNSNDKDNVRVLMVKGEKGDTGEVTLAQLNAEISARTSADNNLQSQINGLASGSPLVASSTSEMTDTTKIYVNTTDGHWYYYNGTAWTDGGDYQSTGIADDSINKNMLDSELKDAIFYSIDTTKIDISECTTIRYMKNTSGDYYSFAENARTLIVPIEPSTTYIVQKQAGQRFALYVSENEPADTVVISNSVIDNTASQLQITSGANDYYLGILYCNVNLDSPVTQEEMLASLKVYEGEITETKTQADYLNSKIDSGDIFNSKTIKLISTKYLGNLTKGYIAISSDDGNNSLADTTIDIFKGYKTTYNKNIPLTMGLMQTSPIFSDNTRKAKVLDLINNYGASVAIHGYNSYTTYTKNELFNFLNSQKNYITTNLVAPTSIIFPNHDYNELSSTIAGSFYGVCCTGGINRPIYYGGDNIQCAGPRSNMYTLYRFSLFNSQTTNQKIKDAIDYAHDNNMIFMPFFHDDTLQNDFTRNKALLDYCVDYANQKGLTFINIGDIPNII